MAQTLDPNSFGFLMGDIVRMIRADMDQRIETAGLGITPGDARTLVRVARCKIARQNTLAEQLGIEAMTLSSSLDRLEKRGLIQREADPSDRRAKLVCLAPAADPVIDAIKRIAREMQKKARGGLSEDEWNDLARILLVLKVNFTP